MAIYDEYNEFFSVLWFTDDNGNKISIQRLNEQQKIVNGKILLNNIPDNFYKVQITGKYEIDINSEITSANYFKVSYLTGEVFFYSSLEGNTIIIAQYFGRGLIKTMAKRVELSNENNLYNASNVEDFAIETINKINAHTTGIADKHTADDIIYSGSAGGNEVQTALNSLRVAIDNVVAGGTEHDALVMAALVDQEGENFGEAGTGTGLDGRLKKWEQRATIYNSVAAIKASTSLSGSSLKTYGYYSIGDGGGADYIVQDSTTEPASFYITLNNGKKAVLVDPIVSPLQVGFKTNVTELDTLAKVRANWTILQNLLTDLKTSKKRKLVSFDTLLTANRVHAEWISGRECPIGFFSDSTTDGATTTGHVPSTSDDVAFTVTITESPNAYPAKLEEYIKLMHKDTDPVRCYNGGFDSESFRSGFGTDHWHNVWFRPAGSNVDFSDVKMIIIGFGTSDSVNLNDTATVIDNYSRDLECVIIDCFLRGVQPVLQAPVLTVQHVGELVNYRNGNESVTIIETIQKQLCKKYNLEYFSMAEPLREALDNFAGMKYSDLMSLDDKVHPTDKGHRIHASYLCTKFNPNIARIELGRNILDLFPGHPAYFPLVATENFAPATYDGKILKRITVPYIGDRTYYYNWSTADGNTKESGDPLLRIPVYVDKPTALFYNNVDNRQTYGQSKLISMYSTVHNLTRTQNLVVEQLKQPEETSFTNKAFTTFLPFGLTIIEVFANDRVDEQRLGGFYLGEVDEHLKGFELGRGSTGASHLTHTINFDPIHATYTKKVSRRKDPLRKHYNAADNMPLEVCLTLDQALAVGATYQIYTHYNDLQAYQDCYNLIEITGDVVTLKVKNLAGTTTLKTETVAGFNALMIAGAKLRLRFTSANFEANGVLFQFFVNNVNQFYYNSLPTELWSEGYGFDAPAFLANSIYITTRTVIQGFVDLDTLL